MTQNNIKIIGITGGIATGKSTTTKILVDKGYKVIDSDKIARKCLELGREGYRRVVEHFGMASLNPDYSINRHYLGAKIFKDKAQREKLNTIIHPYIIEEIKKEINDSKEQILFLDIPLLIEIYDELKNADINISETWLIYCNRETQIERLMKRDNIDLERAESKVNAQIDIEEKRKLVDRIINNEDDEIELLKNIEIALEQIS